MQVVAQKGTMTSLKDAVAVVAISPALLKREKRTPAPSAGSTFAHLNKSLDGALLKRLRDHKVEISKGGAFWLPAISGLPVSGVQLVGWQENKKESVLERFELCRKIGVATIDAARKVKAASISICIDDFDLRTEDQIRALCEGLWLANYQFSEFKKKDSNAYNGPSKVTLLGTRAPSPAVLEVARVYCQATILARDLINLPPNHCTPTVLMQQAKKVARRGALSFKAYDLRALKKMKAGALLAVAQGSEEPPYLLRLSYKPKRVTNKKVIALVGKGVTFDSGGLSIKTGSGMETMKCDMSGAAAVIATMQAVATLKPGIEIRAYVPTTENMINGVATRPGDVVRAMSGKTIEILNTDAEGRLILADALHLAQQDKCDVIIDLATLTGACMVALGTDYAGLFSNNDGLTQRLQSAGDRAGERLWRMPLAKEYKNWIKSPVADIKNIGKSFGGAITAALFLEEFIGEVEWAHLDIAGPAFVDGESGYIKRGGVGFGVRTLLNYLRSL